jgi:hypothetical protein
MKRLNIYPLPCNIVRLFTSTYVIINAGGAKERITGNWGNNIFEGKLEGPQGELFDGHEGSCVAANPVLTMYRDSSDVCIP